MVNESMRIWLYIYISFVHADHPEVVSVFLNKPTKKLTTGAWNFLGLEKDNVIPSNSTWERARFGEDVIIGGIDSGNQVSSLSLQLFIWLRSILLYTIINALVLGILYLLSACLIKHNIFGEWYANLPIFV